MTTQCSDLPQPLLWNALIEEAVEDRVGAGGGHPHQMEDGEPNHDHLVSEEIKRFNEDTENTEGQPAGRFLSI